MTLTLDSVKESADWRNEFGIESENDFDMCANVNSLSDKNSPIFVNVQMAGESLRMMLDTGANVSLVPHSVWMSKWSHIPLKKSSVRLCTFSGSPIDVVGEAQLKIECNDQTICDTVVIVRGGLSPLFGRNWLKHIRLDWNSNLCCSSYH